MKRGSWGAQPVAGLEPQDGDVVIEKQRVSAFFGTPLDVKLRGLGVSTVIVTGAWTNMSVESTIRYGADLGYEMVLVSDGTSTVSAEWQKAATDYAVTNLGRGEDDGRAGRRARRVRTPAALFRAPGRPFELAEVEIEEPGPGDVLVRMHAVGVCGSDLHVVRGEWTRPVPMILGHEGAGVVEAVGDAVTGVRPGDPRGRLLGAVLRRRAARAGAGARRPACRCAPASPGGRCRTARRGSRSAARPSTA